MSEKPIFLHPPRTVLQHPHARLIRNSLCAYQIADIASIIIRSAINIGDLVRTKQHGHVFLQNRLLERVKIFAPHIFFFSHGHFLMETVSMALSLLASLKRCGHFGCQRRKSDENISYFLSIKFCYFAKRRIPVSVHGAIICSRDKCACSEQDESHDHVPVQQRSSVDKRCRCIRKTRLFGQVLHARGTSTEANCARVSDYLVLQ